MVHSVEIAFLFISFYPQTFEARTQANQANITGLGTIDGVFKASGTTFSGREEALLATKSR